MKKIHNPCAIRELWIYHIEKNQYLLHLCLTYTKALNLNVYMHINQDLEFCLLKSDARNPDWRVYSNSGSGTKSIIFSLFELSVW